MLTRRRFMRFLPFLVAGVLAIFKRRTTEARQVDLASDRDGPIVGIEIMPPEQMRDSVFSRDAIVLCLQGDAVSSITLSESSSEPADVWLYDEYVFDYGVALRLVEEAAS